MNPTIPNIYAFNKTSEAGVNVFAPSIFIQGCNLQCPFCFNSTLAKSKMKKEDIVPLSVVDAYIEREEPEMIMISGGEPLMLKNIENLMDYFIAQGLKIGLSTHGMYTDRLIKVLPKVHYVALDVKSNSKDVYRFLDLTGSKDPMGNMIRSKVELEEEKKSRKDFDYEVRTTLYPPYIDIDGLNDLGVMMGKARWVLQQYRPTKRNYDMEACKGIEPYDYDTLQKMLKVAKYHAKEAYIRYV
jgi:pyruvate-formate lyase-activating enzyme